MTDTRCCTRCGEELNTYQKVQDRTKCENCWYK